MKTRKSNAHPMDHAMIRKRKRIQRKAKRFQKYLKEKEKEEILLKALLRNSLRNCQHQILFIRYVQDA